MLGICIVVCVVVLVVYVEVLLGMYYWVFVVHSRIYSRIIRYIQWCYTSNTLPTCIPTYIQQYIQQYQVHVVAYIVVLGIYSSIIRRTRVALLPAVRHGIRQHTSAYVSIRQRMHPCCLQQRPTLVFAYTCSIRYIYLILHFVILKIYSLILHIYYYIYT